MPMIRTIVMIKWRQHKNYVTVGFYPWRNGEVQLRPTKAVHPFSRHRGEPIIMIIKWFGSMRSIIFNRICLPQIVQGKAQTGSYMKAVVIRTGFMTTKVRFIHWYLISSGKKYKYIAILTSGRTCARHPFPSPTWLRLLLGLLEECQVSLTLTIDAWLESSFFDNRNFFSFIQGFSLPRLGWHVLFSLDVDTKRGDFHHDFICTGNIWSLFCSPIRFFHFWLLKVNSASISFSFSFSRFSFFWTTFTFRAHSVSVFWTALIFSHLSWTRCSHQVETLQKTIVFGRF